MSGEDVAVPEPITREEQYLYAICSGGGGGGASAEHEERVPAVKGTVGTLSGSVDTLSSSVESLNTSAEDTSARLTAVENSLASLVDGEAVLF